MGGIQVENNMLLNQSYVFITVFSFSRFHILQNVMHEMVLYLKNTLIAKVLRLKCLLKWHQVIVNYCSKLIDVLQNHFYPLEQNYIYTLMFFYMYWYYSFHPSISFPHSCVARVYKPAWTINYLHGTNHSFSLLFATEVNDHLRIPTVNTYIRSTFTGLTIP